MRCALRYLVVSLAAALEAGLLSARAVPAGEAVGIACAVLAMSQVLLAVWDESISE